MSKLKDFLIDEEDWESSLPKHVLKTVGRFSNEDLLVGNSLTFGYFILSKHQTSDCVELSIIYVEKNQGKQELFLQLLELEKPVTYKDGRVSRHVKNSEGYQSEHPRIYIDGNVLKECGFDIGQSIRVELNSAKQQITIKRK
ncbi:MAG: hypothetical protein CL489_10540 [Acidobacteria bacterium]|nr:hypothetical protein [Acidobacteriota bacterium]|tara:strand:- start:3714 stop:4139 length:426 start_codon:yes stop_codon:yes gene_type:complete